MRGKPLPAGPCGPPNENPRMILTRDWPNPHRGPNGNNYLPICFLQMRISDSPNAYDLESPWLSRGRSAFSKMESPWGLQMLGSEDPILSRDRESHVNAIKKAEFIGLASQGQAPTQTHRSDWADKTASLLGEDLM
jgi:hypothetical protein